MSNDEGAWEEKNEKLCKCHAIFPRKSYAHDFQDVEESRRNCRKRKNYNFFLFHVEISSSSTFLNKLFNVFIKIRGRAVESNIIFASWFIFLGNFHGIYFFDEQIAPKNCDDKNDELIRAWNFFKNQQRTMKSLCHMVIFSAATHTKINSENLNWIFLKCYLMYWNIIKNSLST